MTSGTGMPGYAFCVQWRTASDTQMIRQPLRYWWLSMIRVSQLEGNKRRRRCLNQREKPAGHAFSESSQKVFCGPPPTRIMS